MDKGYQVTIPHQYCFGIKKGLSFIFQACNILLDLEISSFWFYSQLPRVVNDYNKKHKWALVFFFLINDGIFEFCCFLFGEIIGWIVSQFHKKILSIKINARRLIFWKIIWYMGCLFIANYDLKMFIIHCALSNCVLPNPLSLYYLVFPFTLIGLCSPQFAWYQ